MKKLTNCYFIGDIHGEFDFLKEKLENYFSKPDENLNFIQVGDFGIGFQNPDKELKKLINLNQFLKDLRANMFVIRGNHDDPSYWNGNFIFSNLKLIPDYTYLNLNDYKFLLVGGAISLDRIDRINGVSWWENEGLQSPKKNIEEVDVLVMHTNPRNIGHIYGNIKSFTKNDSYLSDDLKTENNIGYDVLQKCNPSRFYCGHHHMSQIGEFALDSGKICKWHILDILEIKQLR